MSRTTGLEAEGGRGARKQWTGEQARELLEEWSRSGKTLAEFARERGVLAQRLSWWRKRLSSRRRRTVQALGPAAQRGELVPAVLASPLLHTPHGSCPVTVRAASGEVVEIAEPSAVAAEWVAELLGALARASR